MARPEARDRSRGVARARRRVRHARRGVDRRGRCPRRRRCAVVALQLSVPQLGEEGARPCERARRRDPRGRRRARAAREAESRTTRARRTVDGRPLLLTRRRCGGRARARARIAPARLSAARAGQTGAAASRALRAHPCAGALRERDARLPGRQGGPHESRETHQGDRSRSTGSTPPTMATAP